ncbi:MAG TPA: efflux RND transporter periplasmic adaptor subunit [Terriglobales bacterium]|nr:efflux RND transporter periplasmic adaptor subunit [Terriglobales bacterium]
MKISAVAILAVLTLAAVAQQSPRLDDIRLSPERLQSIGVTFATAQVENVGDDLRVPGNVAEDEQLQVSVATRVAGWIQQVFVDATYQYVRRGQPLFTLYSPEVAATEQEYLLALGNAKRLAASTVPGVAADAQSLAQAAAARLQQWNVPQAEIERVASSGKALPAFTVVSPAAGYVTVRNVLPNQQVEPQAELYRVNPLSPVWVFAQVNQNNLGRVRTGAPVTVTVDSYPGRVFAGRVEFIYPQIDAATRTARVRLVFDNPGRALMPGMFVNADLKLSFGRRLVVPTSAVLQTGTQAIAFVDEGGGRLSPRPLELGGQVGDLDIVLKGLKGGDRVVSSANFLIDSESQLQAAAGAFMPPPPGAGQAAAVNQPARPAAAAATAATVSLTTQPSPPHKGKNTLQVRLASAASPIADAQVSVTFSMPAMPAMGMSALTESAQLASVGGGLYQGALTLPNGGTWQVTVTARRGGQLVASRSLSLLATGGT